MPHQFGDYIDVCNHPGQVYGDDGAVSPEESKYGRARRTKDASRKTGEEVPD